MLSHFVLTMNLYQYGLTPVTDSYFLKSLKYQIMRETLRLYLFHHTILDDLYGFHHGMIRKVRAQNPQRQQECSYYPHSILRAARGFVLVRLSNI